MMSKQRLSVPFLSSPSASSFEEGKNIKRQILTTVNFRREVGREKL